MEICNIKQLHTDGAFIRSICASLKNNGQLGLAKSINDKCKTIYDCLSILGQSGFTPLPLDDLDSVTVIYEKLNVLIDFVNAGVLGSKFINKRNAKNLLFDILNINIDPNQIYIAMDTSFKPGENIFVITNSTKLKKLLSKVKNTNGGIVMSSVFPNASDKDLPTTRQLISFNLFLETIQS